MSITDEDKQAIYAKYRAKADAEIATLERYAYWCEECHTFVASSNHRCEQWARVILIPIEALNQWADKRGKSE